MPLPSQVMLYVNDPAKSAVFYRDILGKEPKVLSPNFAVVDIGHGFKLSLFARAKVEPPAVPGVSSELIFEVEDENALESLHQQWVAKGVAIALPPKKMYFGGFNFMALDPDGNRLRVSTPDRA